MNSTALLIFLSACLAVSPVRAQVPTKQVVPYGYAVYRPKGGATDETTLRIRVESSDGVFVVYDRPTVDAPLEWIAVAPQLSDGAEDSADPPSHSGAGDGRGDFSPNAASSENSIEADVQLYLAYWRGFDLPHLYVFNRLVRDPVDLGHALHALHRDLGVDVQSWSDLDDTIRSAWDAASEVPHNDTTLPGFTDSDAVGAAGARIPSRTPDDAGIPSRTSDARDRRDITRGRWEPATGEGLKAIIRDDAPDAPEDDLEGAPEDAPEDAIEHAPPLRQFPMPAQPPVDCDACGPYEEWPKIGKPKKPPHRLTMDESLWVVVMTTACCCPTSNACCGSPDPCCDNPSACCGSPDPCCGSPDPCCGSSDPCCDSPDPCCGSTDPCCDSSDPCCGSSDPCCDSPDPCCGSGDPCCDSPDPCCGDPDPCCDNPDPCCGDPDPCCGVTCNDNDSCTTDACVFGACVYTPITCNDGKTCTNDFCMTSGCTESLCEDPAAECETACPCVHQCIHESCGLTVQMPALTVCPGGTGRLEFDVTNTSGCIRFIRVTLRDTSNGSILYSSALGSLGLQSYFQQQTRHWSPTLGISADSPLAAGSLAIDVTATGNGCAPDLCASAAVTVNVEWLVDLDVDSNNDGVIDANNETEGETPGTDDPIELDFPGKWLWINNDDSDMNGVPDNADADAGEIDGVDDALEDIVDVLIRPMNPAQLPAGAQLFVELSDPSIVRVFDGNFVFSVPILGPAFPTVVEIPIPTAPRCLGVEGLASGSVTLSLILRDAAGAELCRDAVVLTVVRVATLTWAEFNSTNTPLDTCPNNGGRRVFPDRKTPVDPDAADRGKIDLVAFVTPVVEGVPVQFRVYDIDDPFDQNNPGMPSVHLIDDNDAGPDNRILGGGADSAVGAWSAPTNPVGLARVTIDLSMQPGNNYRGTASAMADGLSDINLPQTVVDANTVPPYALFTDMLTVWRRVWLELDSMAAGTDISYTGAIDAIGSGTAAPHLLDGIAELDVPDINDDGRFEGGTLTVPATGRVYELIDNVDVAVDDDYTTAGLIVGGDLNQIGTVVDDDAAVLPRTPDANTSILNDKYRNCYLVFTEHTPSMDINNTFVGTLDKSCTELAGVGADNADLAPAPDFWLAIVITCYQSHNDVAGPFGLPNASTRDGDPDFCYHLHGALWNTGDPGIILGTTCTGAGNYSSFFYESALDMLAQVATGCMTATPRPLAFVEPNVIAHELGHQFGLHDVGVGVSLMSPYDGVDRSFIPGEINQIRSSTSLDSH